LSHEWVAVAERDELARNKPKSSMSETGTYAVLVEDIANSLPGHALSLGGELCLLDEGGKDCAVVLILEND
jgi:hypothetical protein